MLHRLSARRADRNALTEALGSARWLGRAVLAGLGLLALGLFLACAPLSLCLLALASVGGGILLLRRPALGLLALAFTIPFGSLRELHLGGVTLGLSELMLLAILAAWAARWTALGQGGIRRLPLTGPILLFLGAASLALLPAQNLAPALKEWLKWVEFLLLYLMVGSALRPGERRGVAAALLLAGCLEAALGLYQFLFQVGPPGFILFGRYMRAYGTFRQPNPFGGYVGLLLPLGYAIVWLRGRSALSPRSGAAWSERALWALALVASALLALALAASWSRGALVGLAGGLLLVALAVGWRRPSRGAGARGRVWPLLLIGVLLLALAGPALTGMLPAGFLDRLADTVTLAGQDLTTIEIDDANFALVERLAHWRAAWRMFAQRPWLGVGLGQYATVYPTVAVPRWQDPLGHAHNYYLNILAEGGMPGLAAYLAFWALTVAAAWRRARRSAGWERALALAALGMLGHLLAHSLFDNLYVHEMYLLIAVILGMGCGAGDDATTHGAPTHPPKEG
jgi:O-antigen ligase